MIDPMAVVQGAKEIAELVKKYKDVPLYEKIVQLQGQVVELAGERLELHTDNQQLKQQLKLKAKTRFENPFYWQEGDEVPLCAKCYDTSKGELRVHLTHPPEDWGYQGFGRYCNTCQ